MKRIFTKISCIAALIISCHWVGAEAFTRSGDETLLFGYCGNYSSSIGTSNSQITTDQAAIEIPKELAASWKGSTLTGVQIGYGISSVKDVTVYLTKALDAEPFYSQHAVMTVAGGWNTVSLDAPYEIGDEPFFVGYSVNVNSLEDKPIGIDNIKNNDSYGAYVNLYDEWEKVGRFYGNVCIRLYLTGDNLPQNDVEVNEIMAPEIVEADSPFEAEFIITNKGVKPVESLTVSCNINGVETTVPTVTLADGAIASGMPGMVRLSGLKTSQTGLNLPMEVTVLTVNGETPVTSEGNSASTVMTVAEKAYHRNVVIEEFTGTWCGWCPLGIVGMSYMKEKYGKDGFIGIAVHYGDEMAVDSYSGFADAVSGGRAPSAYIDRSLFFLDPSPEALELNYLAAVKTPSIASVQLNAVYSKDDNSLTVTSSAEFGVDIKDAGYAMAYVIVENNVGPYTQKNDYAGGASGDLPGWSDNTKWVETMYNEVARDIKFAYGIEGSIPSSIVSLKPCDYTTQLSLENVYDIKECEVVALLLDTTTGRIVNAARSEISMDGAGIDSVAEDATGIETIYNLQGQKVNKENIGKGIYVINGKKVMIK